MTNPLDDALIEFLIAISKKAGNAIMEFYHTEFLVRKKIDNSPVTEADEKAESIIRFALNKRHPDIPFVGEEAYAKGHRPDLSGGLFWLVDALDGTKEFIQCRDEFTVNIALVEFGNPILGVVHAPAKQETYWGSSAGAYLEEKNQGRRPIRTRVPSKNGLTVTMSHSHRADEEEYLKDYNIKERTHSGSSLKFCFVAAGKADLYPRLGTTSEWDTAAGHAILSFAGGQMTGLDGTPIMYGKNDIKNPFFVARGQLIESIKA